jgi:hypothetical protein
LRVTPRRDRTILPGREWFAKGFHQKFVELLQKLRICAQRYVGERQPVLAHGDQSLGEFAVARGKRRVGLLRLAQPSTIQQRLQFGVASTEIAERFEGVL